MRFYNHKSSAIFDIYLKYTIANLILKNLSAKSLLVGETWSETGISKLLKSFKKI